MLLNFFKRSNFYFYFISLLILFSTNTLVATPVRNPELSNAIANVFSTFADKKYELTAEYCQKILTSKNPEIQKELKELKLGDNSPLSLQLHVVRLDCLTYLRQRPKWTFREECKKVIAKYKNTSKTNNADQLNYISRFNHYACHYCAINNKDMKNMSLNECNQIISYYKNVKKADGMNWPNYVSVYYHLACHYSAMHDKKMEAETLKEGADLLPKSHLPVRYAYNIMNNSSEPLPTKIVYEVKRVIKKNKELNNNKLTSGMAYCKVILTKKTNGNAFQEAVNFLKSYPDADYPEIKEVVEIARDAIPFSNPEKVRDYYNMLLVLAIKQPGTKDRLKVIGFIINEKNKLETIMPELKK